MDKRYEACLVVHALGDTIGFRNGTWEFNYGKHKYTAIDMLEIMYDFIGLGGINHLDTKNWNVSDDTLLHLAVADTYLDSNTNEIAYTMKKLIKKLINEFNDMEHRYPGVNTTNMINQFKDGLEWDKVEYNNEAGGSGGSMKSLCVGLIYNGKENRTNLIQHAIETGRLTHNCATGFLGSLVSALFTAYAIENIPIKEWPFKLIKLLESDIIDNYIKSTRDYDNYSADKYIFIGKWKQYIEDKFDNKKNVKKPMINLVRRVQYYQNTFSESSYIGAGGDDSVIIAYDSLIDAGNNWEKLVIYSMLHIGDTDTTGCIAGGWYGAIYGFHDIPKHYIENLEYKDRISNTGKRLCEKFYNKLI